MDERVFLPKGTRDFMPDAMRRRLYVIGIVREVFERFGFEPLETPSFERIETLAGRYGDEGEKLIYKILERGEGGKTGAADLALRYDLTVPLARVMAMHPELRLPFKRYQMQPVWRADRPQKGRYREFWQCDVDVCGTTSLLADSECLAVVAAALDALGFREYTIRVNDRRILSSLARLAGADSPRREAEVLVALDKLDKIGREGVDRELVERGFLATSALWAALDVPAGGELRALHDRLDPTARAGAETLGRVVDAAIGLGVAPRRIRVDPTIARGLGYYTGMVFETEVVQPKIGSISSGGRYDELIGMFAGRPIPSVGASLGLERIITVMEELGMLPSSEGVPRVMVAVYGPETLAPTLAAAKMLRDAGIATDLFADEAKLGRQLKHANARGYRWVVVVGPEEVAKDAVSLKDLASGAQETLSLADAIRRIADETVSFGIDSRAWPLRSRS